MTITLWVHERRLSDDSLVYDVTILGDHAEHLRFHAVSVDDATRFVGKVGDAIRDHTTEVLSVTKWVRAE